jgi:hypothetical protein
MSAMLTEYILAGPILTAVSASLFYQHLIAELAGVQ